MRMSVTLLHALGYAIVLSTFQTSRLRICVCGVHVPVTAPLRGYRRLWNAKAAKNRSPDVSRLEEIVARKSACAASNLRVLRVLARAAFT